MNSSRHSRERSSHAVMQQKLLISSLYPCIGTTSRWPGKSALYQIDRVHTPPELHITRTDTMLHRQKSLGDAFQDLCQLLKPDRLCQKQINARGERFLLRTRAAKPRQSNDLGRLQPLRLFKCTYLSGSFEAVQDWHVDIYSTSARCFGL